MFAGAAREAVFSKAEVVRRINREFIPVALKAAHVNNLPTGPEGVLYREIGRSRPAPQGICVANSAGKALGWVLMFDDDKSVLGFLDHTLKRYREFPDAAKRVPAERFMRFPSHKLPDVRDTTGSLTIPERHDRDRCPGRPGVAKDTLVGRIIGRALDEHGKPLKDTTRQEQYMEARLEIPPAVQRSLIDALQAAGSKPFSLPDDFARALVQPAFLGQLDVSPLGNVSGSRNDKRSWRFSATRVDSKGPSVRMRFTGTSSLAGGQSQTGARTDGRRWEHAVDLTWEGYIDIDPSKSRVTQLLALARGNERLRWGNARLLAATGPAVRNLPAGRPIDLKCGVRYGLLAAPAPEAEVVAASPSGRGSDKTPPPQMISLQRKMQRVQAALRNRERYDADLIEVAKLTRQIGPLVQQRKLNDAEAVLDKVLKLLESESKPRPSKE